jgi:hypothetical protein
MATETGAIQVTGLKEFNRYMRSVGSNLPKEIR